MDRVAGEVHTSRREVRRDDQVRRPRIRHQDLELEVAARPLAENRGRIERSGIDGFRQKGVQCPCVVIVLRDKRAARRLPMPPRPVWLQQITPVGAKMNRESAAYIEGAFEADAELGARAAAASVATRQVLAL